MEYGLYIRRGEGTTALRIRSACLTLIIYRSTLGGGHILPGQKVAYTLGSVPKASVSVRVYVLGDDKHRLLAQSLRLLIVETVSVLRVCDIVAEMGLSRIIGLSSRGTY